MTTLDEIKFKTYYEQIPFFPLTDHVKNAPKKMRRWQIVNPPSKISLSNLLCQYPIWHSTSNFCQLS